MKRAVDERMEHFEVKSVSFILWINVASSGQTVITSSDKISPSPVALFFSSEAF